MIRRDIMSVRNHALTMCVTVTAIHFQMESVWVYTIASECRAVFTYGFNLCQVALAALAFFTRPPPSPYRRISPTDRRRSIAALIIRPIIKAIEDASCSFFWMIRLEWSGSGTAALIITMLTAWKSCECGNREWVESVKREPLWNRYSYVKSMMTLASCSPGNTQIHSCTNNKNTNNACINEEQMVT